MIYLTEASQVAHFVKNPPANAEDRGSISGPGRFHRLQGNSAHALQLRNPKSTEPAYHNYRSIRALVPKLCNERSHGNGKPMHHNKAEPLPAATRESLWQLRPQYSQKQRHKLKHKSF